MWYNRLHMAPAQNYKTFFKGKAITVMGIEPEGRGVQDAEFLARHHAKVVVTDIKNEKALAQSVTRLRRYKNISFALGGHRLADFRKKDLVIRAAVVPLGSIYVTEAKKNGIEVRTDETLFLKLAPEITVVGVTGTRGKSTVTHLIHYILQGAGKSVFLGGNVRGRATLPLLSKVQKGSILVMELDSWKLQGFGDAKISPHISVFTNFFPDHLNYYQGRMDWYFRDKANIFKFQKKGQVLIVGEQAIQEIKARFKGTIKSEMCVARKSMVPKTWKIKIPGEHNRANIACARVVCQRLGVSEEDIKYGVESFVGVPGRLELVRTVRGVKYINDTTATSPAGLFAALDVFADKKTKNVVLLAGGADKQLDYRLMAGRIDKTVKALILFKGEGTDKIVEMLAKKKKYPFFVVDSMQEAMRLAVENAEKGDTVLLSPGTASFGVFKNEFDRGDQFVALVKKLS